MKIELTEDEKKRDAKIKAEVLKDWKRILPEITPKEWGYWTIQEVHDKYKTLTKDFYCEVSGGWRRFYLDGLYKKNLMDERYEKWLKNTLNKRRPTSGEWNKIVGVFGVWMVCKNGSIDYGSSEGYCIPADWHKNVSSYWLPHVMRKGMSKGHELDLLRAFGYSAKIQGLDSFQVGTDIY